MQYLPEKEDLLEAVAHFLAKQAAPAVDDPALAFRLKVAAHLVHGAARESRDEETKDLELLSALGRALQVQPEPRSSSRERHEQIRDLFGQLSERIRDPATEPPRLDELRRLVMEVLAQGLRVNQPKFDLSIDIERAEPQT